MDKRVYYFFAFVFITAAGSFSFRYSNYEPCVDVDFSFDQLEPKVGSVIQFRDYSKGANEWEWDFGDNTDIKNQKNEFHVFDKPGFYEVTLKINNSCELTKPIYVEAKTKVLDSTNFPEFNLPKSIRVGEKLVVTDKSEKANTWEWRFGETISANARTKRAEHIYKKPGTYTVSLIINDEIDYLVKKKIQVQPRKERKDTGLGILKKSNQNVLNLPDAPEAPIEQLSAPLEKIDIVEKIEPEVVVKSPEIKEILKTPEKTEEESEIVSGPSLNKTIITNSLQSISKRQMSAQEFSKYFCEEIDSNPLVIANYKSYTFQSFCKFIKGKTVLVDKITWGSEKKCIYSFEVSITR